LSFNILQLTYYTVYERFTPSYSE